MRPVTPIALTLAAFVVVAAVAGCGGPVRTPAPTTFVSASGLPAAATGGASGGDAPGSSPVPPPSPGSTRSAGAASTPVSPADLAGTIAFSFDDGVWVSDADGGHRRPLRHDGGFDPTLSPDGREIVYRRLLEHDDGEIWAMSASGAGRHDLVDDPAFSDWGPAWSPDGRRIAFDSNRRGGLAIWLMDADGSHPRIVTTGHGEYPSWSPDGTKLAYSGGSYYDIRVVGIDGSNDHALTSSPAYDMGPAWSPDGAWIAYHTQADAWPRVEEAGMGNEMEIHLVRPDGSDDHRITDDSVEDSFPAWSPDGRFLMWARHGELVVARPDGSGRIDIGPGNFPTWVR
jgi:Tol biopolymer transport system component